MFYSEIDEFTQEQRIWVTTGRKQAHKESRQGLGAMVRAERDHLDMTQADVAAVAKCSMAYVGFFERGYKLPSIEVLTRILGALETGPVLDSTGSVVTFELNSQKATVILTIEGEGPPARPEWHAEREAKKALMLGQIVQILTTEPHLIRDVYRDLGLDPDYLDRLEQEQVQIWMLEDQLTSDRIRET